MRGEVLPGTFPLREDFCVLVQAFHGLLDLIWPPRTACLLCQGPLGDGLLPKACNSCLNQMAFPAGLPRCEYCNRPVLRSNRCCEECAAGSPFGRAWALGLHQGALREAIHHLKFSGHEELAVPLGRLLAERVGQPYGGVVPVPLHRSRLRERGYNQALLVAQGIAAQRGWPVWDGVLIRVRSTGHQAKLDRADRLKNLQCAFQVPRACPPWSGQAVLLVDDVLTTGATAASAAAAILASGASRVDLAVLAVSTTPVGAMTAPETRDPNHE